MANLVIKHIRAKDPLFNLMQKGGATIVYTRESIDHKQDSVLIGLSLCNPTDTFDRKIGRNTAIVNFQEDPYIIVIPRGIRLTSTELITHLINSVIDYKVTMLAERIFYKGSRAYVYM